MDKNTFMRELERSLSVLQESELRDILSEYEQHIDMKVKSGLSEEEAIADFGSIPELTAEILEAYMYGPISARDKGTETAGEQRKTAGTMGTEPAKTRETEKKNAGRRKHGRPGQPDFFRSWEDGPQGLSGGPDDGSQTFLYSGGSFLGGLSGGFPGSGSRGRRSSCI